MYVYLVSSKVVHLSNGFVDEMVVAVFASYEAAEEYVRLQGFDISTVVSDHCWYSKIHQIEGCQGNTRTHQFIIDKMKVYE